MLMAMGHKPNRNPFQKGIAFSTQCTARTDAVHCRSGCSALRERLQCTASEMGKTGIVIASPVLDKRKGRKDSLHIRVSVAAPRKFLLSRYGP